MLRWERISSALGLPVWADTIRRFLITYANYRYILLSFSHRTAEGQPWCRSYHTLEEAKEQAEKMG